MSNVRNDIFVDSDELEGIEPATWRLIVESTPLNRTCIVRMSVPSCNGLAAK